VLSILSASLLMRHLGIADNGHYTDVVALVAIVQGIMDTELGPTNGFASSPRVMVIAVGI
jgi:hypothetical protein